MAYKAKAYTLREESTESGIRYFISFKDGQGESPRTGSIRAVILMEFRQMERRNRNLLQWDERHREFIGSMGRNAEQAGVKACLRALRNK